MATVLREPEQEQAGAPAGDGGAVPPFADGAPATAETPVRTCRACGAGMTEEQDWCLECGTARPGRLGTRPGWRAAATVSATTLLLVCGAVAASYAALTNDAGQKADQPGADKATPVAQAPPAITPPAATTGATALTPPPATATTTGIPTTATPATTGSTKLPALPQLPTGGTTTPTTSNTTTTTGSTTPTTTSNTTTTTSSTTTTTKTTTTPALTPVSLDADAADLYDPYQRASAKGDPADAYDANAKDAWFVTAPGDGKPMQVGLLVELGARRTIRQIDFATATPGFRVEVYTTDGSALPPDILDTRWTHVASRSSVDKTTAGDNVKGDGKESIRLPSSVQPARKVVLWLTTPPSSGTTVKIRDLVLKQQG